MKRTTKKKKVVKQKKQNKEKNWFTLEAMIKLGIIFFTIQLIGLLVAHNLYTQGYSQALFTENINDAINGIYLFGMIIVTTIIFLLIVKFKRTKNCCGE